MEHTRFLANSELAVMFKRHSRSATNHCSWKCGITAMMQRRPSESGIRTFAESKYKAHTSASRPLLLSRQIHTDIDTIDSMVLSINLSPEGFPPLPHIRSDDTRRQVYTHRSFYARPKDVFEDPPDDPAPDNETLEHLGDSVLGLSVTGLIRQTYRNLRVGPATKMRALVVGNATLADISLHYGLPQRLRVHPAQAITLRSSPNVQADIFEAYVGGLYVDQGLPVVQTWLNNLLRPYVVEAYRIVRNQHILPPAPAPVERQPSSPGSSTGSGNLSNGTPPPAAATMGHLSLFNQHMQQTNTVVEWRYDNVRGEGTRTTPIWKVHAMIGNDCLASGQGNTKRMAKNEAAKEGLSKMGVVIPEIQV
ncbi:ribonuclease III [Rickenella mellea]|uniref:Ribonuclease III n=1 Tax=Rickenella mellea TaxID=50990 RepID=A0A4R5XE60_9AGAM|nr:ribonuclease III [Rickenella mellea]